MGCKELADLPRVLKQTQDAIKSSRELLERSQRFIQNPAKLAREDEVRQVVQGYIDDQRVIAERLRRKMT